MSSVKRSYIAEDALEAAGYLQHSEKRQKLETGYSLNTIKHWVISKLPRLSQLLTTTTTTTTEAGRGSETGDKRGLLRQESGEDQAGEECITAWTFLSSTSPLDVSPSRERRVVARRKRQVTCFRRRQNSSSSVQADFHAPAPGKLSGPMIYSVEAHGKMDARLSEVSGRLQALIKTGQEALSRKPQDLA